MCIHTRMHVMEKRTRNERRHITDLLKKKRICHPLWKIVNIVFFCLSCTGERVFIILSCIPLCHGFAHVWTRTRYMDAWCVHICLHAYMTTTASTTTTTTMMVMIIIAMLMGFSQWKSERREEGQKKNSRELKKTKSVAAVSYSCYTKRKFLSPSVSMYMYSRLFGSTCETAYRAHRFCMRKCICQKLFVYLKIHHISTQNKNDERAENKEIYERIHKPSRAKRHRYRRRADDDADDDDEGKEDAGKKSSRRKTFSFSPTFITFFILFIF